MGLYWFKEGVNYCGSVDDVRICFLVDVFEIVVVYIFDNGVVDCEILVESGVEV